MNTQTIADDSGNDAPPHCGAALPRPPGWAAGRIRLLDAESLQALHRRMDPEERTPLHPNAVGVSIGMFSCFNAIFTLFLAALGIFGGAVLFLEESDSTWLSLIIRACAIFLGGGLLWAAYTFGVATRVHRLRATVILEPDAIRWLRTDLLRRRCRVLPRSEIRAVDFVRIGGKFAVFLRLASGESLDLLKNYLTPDIPAWLAWAMHDTLRVPLTGNMPLDTLRAMLEAGKLKSANFMDGRNGPPPMQEKQDAPLPPRLPATRDIGSGFLLYGGADPDLPAEPRSYLTVPGLRMNGHDRIFAVARSLRSLRHAACALALVAIAIFGLTVDRDVPIAGWFDSLREGFTRLLGWLFLAANIVALFVFLFGKIWFIGDVRTGLLRRRCLFVKMDRAVAIADVTRVECLRDNDNPDSYEISLRLRDGGDFQVFHRVDGETRDHLAAALAAWSGAPVYERLALDGRESLETRQEP